MAKALLPLLIVVALVAASAALWHLFPRGQNKPPETVRTDPPVQQPDGRSVPLRLIGTLEYTVRDANGNVREHGVIHNTVNDPEALNEIFNRISGTASGGAYDGIAALSVPATGGGADDPSDGVLDTSITLNLDGDNGTVGHQNPADGTITTDFGTESGNGTVVVTFTALANGVEVKQVVLTKAAEDNTLVGGAASIDDAEIFSYLDVADVTLNTNDTVQYTWTVDVD